MDRQIIRLYDQFAHGGITRRVFLDRVASLTGSAAAASALLPLLQNNYARAAIVATDDPRLAIKTASYDAPNGKMSGYLARLKERGKRPAVLVIHENRGLNRHIEDVARRLAVEGFLALAVDLLSPQGGTPAHEDKARELFGALKVEDAEKNLTAAVPFLAGHPQSTGKVGVVGFCWGGGMVNRVAMISPDLKAAVAYYGPIPADKSKVRDIRARLLLHYAGLDERVNAGIPAWEQALKAAGKSHTIYLYPNAQHAFNNDTGGVRYNKAAADLAWGRTLTFLKENLGAPRRA